MILRRTASLLMCSLMLVAAIAAEEPSPEELLASGNILGGSGSVVMKVSMSIETSRGSKERGLEVYIRREGDGSKVLAQIVAPAFLSSLKFLYHRDPGGKESKWLKTSRGVRLLSEAQRSERLFDSDFTAEDLSDVNPAKFRLRSMSAQSNGALVCIEAIPVEGRSFYDRKVLCFDSGTRILRRIDYFDGEGGLIKQYTLDETQLVDGELYPARSTMRDLRSGGQTELRVEGVEAGDSIPDRLFSRANL